MPDPNPQPGFTFVRLIEGRVDAGRAAWSSGFAGVGRSVLGLVLQRVLLVGFTIVAVGLSLFVVLPLVLLALLLLVLALLALVARALFARARRWLDDQAWRPWKSPLSQPAGVEADFTPFSAPFAPADQPPPAATPPTDQPDQPDQPDQTGRQNVRVRPRQGDHDPAA
jgi:hypothetical protein